VRTPPLRSLLLPAALLTLIALVAVVPAAPAAAADDVPNRPVSSEIAADGTSRITLSPARFDVVDAEPGTSLQLALEVTNYSSDAVRLSTLVIPLVGSEDPDSFATPGDATSRSADAVDWVQMPFERWPSLGPTTKLRFPVTVQVPNDARPGTYALGLVVSQRIGGGGIAGLENNEAMVRLGADLASQLVIRLPGDAVTDLRVRDVESPRVVWGGTHPTFEAMAYNEGDTLLAVDAELQLDAFIGTARRDLATESQELLPGGRRAVTMKWNDPPLFGWFTPKLVVVGGTGSGVRVERTLPTVWVLPPWWFLVLLALAIIVPTWRLLRRRRDPAWQEHRRRRSIERVDARERKARARERAEQARRGGRR
jgi:hypothetical protein